MSLPSTQTTINFLASGPGPNGCCDAPLRRAFQIQIPGIRNTAGDAIGIPIRSVNAFELPGRIILEDRKHVRPWSDVLILYCVEEIKQNLNYRSDI